MGYTYISRYDTGDLCKFGKATTLAARQSSLRTGSAGKLELFDYVESEHALEGERFLKRRWAGRLHRHRSEIFRLTEDECRHAMTELRHYLAHELPVELAKAQELSELEAADNDDTMIEAAEDVLAAHRRLVRIEAELRTLNAEAEPLRRAIQLAIGKNRGITGVATFDKADTNRSFNTERFQAEHPELFAQFQKSVFDATAFGKKHRDLAEAFREPGKKRTSSSSSRTSTAEPYPAGPRGHIVVPHGDSNDFDGRRAVHTRAGRGRGEPVGMDRHRVPP